MLQATEYRVGPHGYIHGWIFVGIPGVGAKVSQPEHGHGTVKGVGAGHVTIGFEGGDHKVAREPGPGPGRLERAAEVPAVKDPKAFLDSHYGGWRNSLSPAHEKAMRFYQSPGFALMNGQLRGLDREGLKKTEHASDSDLARAEKASKDLTAAIRKAPPLPHDVTVYRGFDADQFGDLKPGSVISDKAFTSTSLTNDVQAVGRARRQAKAEIILPQGTKAAAGSARELVLPPGSRFRVIEVKGKGGVVKLEYIPPGHR